LARASIRSQDESIVRGIYPDSAVTQVAHGEITSVSAAKLVP
jgi:hypothetical protein